MVTGRELELNLRHPGNETNENVASHSRASLVSTQRTTEVHTNRPTAVAATEIGARRRHALSASSVASEQATTHHPSPTTPPPHTHTHTGTP